MARLLFEVSKIRQFSTTLDLFVGSFPPTVSQDEVSLANVTSAKALKTRALSPKSMGFTRFCWPRLAIKMNAYDLQLPPGL